MLKIIGIKQQYLGEPQLQLNEFRGKFWNSKGYNNPKAQKPNKADLFKGAQQQS
ncbi:unnamed protein product [Paramecium pentaurelia]|uniref:Uncharacterized protein n=1 Tax=Paramecium pentaurelia TaxID=43138 RepID=A0A8S1XB33_9CILI|nr:unnamed protein product [Paramecium pentaurelia]